MSRRLRVRQPPRVDDRQLADWMREVTDAINVLPNMSIISTSNGPNSAYTGNSGDIAVDIGSSATTFWVKRIGDGSMSGWSALGFA